MAYIQAIIAVAVVLLIIILCVICVLRKLKAGGIKRPQAHGPLAGVKILDMSVVIAAPWATSQLSDLGAEVIKVESMANPDVARGIGAGPLLGISGMFAHSGRGKQSIVINMKTEEGKEVFLRFAKQVDVIVQNFRPGVVEQLGIGYEDIKKVNPDIIYLSSSGFGPTGPYSKSRIYDPVIQAFSGCTHIQSETKKRLIPHFIMDKATALTSVQAVLAALIARDRGAGGQYIDIRMLNCGVQFLWPDIYHDYTWLPKTEIPTQDNKGQCESKQKIESTSIVDGLEESKKPILGFKDAFENRSSWDVGKHALFGKFKSVKYPCVFGGTRLMPRPACPMLGEHTVKLMKEIGYTTAEIEILLESKAITSTKSLMLSRGGDIAKKAKIFGYIESLQGGSTFRKASNNEGREIPAEVNLNSGPLTGMKVLDMSNLLAGPMACCILADQGADVIKVENEDSLDPSRNMGPSPYHPSMGSMFLAVNRNKRSITINPSSDDGKAILEKLIQKTEMIIIDTDIATSMNICYKKARQLNPNVIYMVIDKTSGELATQAMSGICHAVEDENDQLTYIKSMLCEKITAHFTASAASAAYFALGQGGRGQCVNINMLDAVMYYSMCDIFMNETWDKTTTNRLDIKDVYNTVYKSKDGIEFYSICVSDKEWNGWVTVFKDDLSDYKDKIEGEWSTLQGRIKSVKTLVPIWVKINASYTFAELKKKNAEADVVCAPFLSREQMLDDPQVVHNKIVCSMDYENLGPYRAPIPAPIFSKTPAKLRIPAPLPGAHTEHILKDIGFLKSEFFTA